jgi:hypothetical protein
MSHHAGGRTGPRKIVQVPTGPPLPKMRMLAGLHGVLEGSEAGPDRWCLWVRSESGSRVPLVWPAGFSARLDPLEVLNATGETFAHVGEHLFLRGGFFPVDPDNPCSLGRNRAFYVQQEKPTRANGLRELIAAREREFISAQARPQGAPQ